MLHVNEPNNPPKSTVASAETNRQPAVVAAPTLTFKVDPLSEAHVPLVWKLDRASEVRSL